MIQRRINHYFFQSLIYEMIQSDFNSSIINCRILVKYDPFYTFLISDYLYKWKKPLFSFLNSDKIRSYLHYRSIKKKESATVINIIPLNK
jgi:hypothetical protein